MVPQAAPVLLVTILQQSRWFWTCPVGPVSPTAKMATSTTRAVMSVHGAPRVHLDSISLLPVPLSQTPSVRATLRVSREDISANPPPQRQTDSALHARLVLNIKTNQTVIVSLADLLLLCPLLDGC